MSVIVFGILLFVYQVYLSIKNINENNKFNNEILLTVIITSLLIIILYSKVIFSNISLIGLKSLYYSSIFLSFFCLYVVMFVISALMILTKKKNINNKNDGIVKIIINVVMIFVCFFISLIIELLPYKSIKKDNEITANKAKEKVILLLNEKYGSGDNNFKVIKMYEKNICTDCSSFAKIDGYEFEISMDYLDTNFTVKLEKKNLRLYEDNFLDIYYKERENIKNLDYYLENYEADKINKKLIENFNATINFSYKSINNYRDNIYGYIPSIDELSSFSKLYDPQIDINENLKTREELLNYLVKLSNYYINDLDKSNIMYNRSSKYFRYKYDYKKIGIDNYTDQFNGYGGYVFAGKFKYSTEQEKYLLEDEYKVVRINLLGKTTLYDIRDFSEIKDN